MKQSTINRIIHNFENHKMTAIGQYIYSVQYYYKGWNYCIMRCKKSDIGKTWINHDGQEISSWEFVQPIKTEEN